MIELTYQQGLVLYLGIWLITIFVLWVREFLRLRRRDRQLSAKHPFQCRVCHLSFLSREEEESNAARCPRCNAMCLR